MVDHILAGVVALAAQFSCHRCDLSMVGRLTHAESAWKDLRYFLAVDCGAAPASLD